MPYMQLLEEPTLGWFGCGPGCGSPQFGSEGSIAFPGVAGTPTPAPPPAGPRFRFTCAAGCSPIAAAQCRAVVRRAISDAINLATNAARRLEARPVDATTVRWFRFFYCHNPSRPVPWAGNRASGDIVARRYRIVARELRTRGTLYRCGCPGASATVNAQTLLPYTLNTVELCPRFWTLTPILRAGVVLHEMFHVYFGQFFRHRPNDPEHRRDNAHCHEAFALRVAGHTPETGDVTACRSRPC